MEGLNNINNAVLSQIIKTILTHKQVEKVLLFGSRANGGFKEASDIDLAIFAKNWSDKDLNLVKDKLEHSVKTPLKFDLLNFYKLSKVTLKKEILKEGKVIYDSEKNK